MTAMDNETPVNSTLAAAGVDRAAVEAVEARLAVRRAALAAAQKQGRERIAAGEITWAQYVAELAALLK